MVSSATPRHCASNGRRYLFVTPSDCRESISRTLKRKVFEDFLFAHAGGEHFQHVFDPNAHAADAGAVAALFGIKGDAIEVFIP